MERGEAVSTHGNTWINREVNVRFWPKAALQNRPIQAYRTTTIGKSGHSTD
jgi:hypothetical protein